MTTAAQPPHPLRAGLGFRVLVLVTVGVALPTLLFAGLIWTHLGDLDARLLEGRQGAAVAVAEHLDEELVADLEVLQRIASAVTVEDREHDPDRIREALRRGYVGFHFVGGLFLLDDHGQLVVEEPMHLRRAAPPPDLPAVQEVLRTGKPLLSDLVRDGDAVRIYAMVAVMNWRGQIAGVVGGLVDPSLARQAGVLRHLRPGPAGHADLVDGAGTILASTDRARVRNPVGCRAHLAALATGHGREVVRCGDCHAGDGRGGPAIRAVAALSAGRWAVVVEQPEAAVLATVGALPGAFPVLALVGLAGAALFGWGVARSVTRPLARLGREAERIAAGELGEPIPDLGEDEVGRLARSLERMRGSLAELIGIVAEANTALEGRVAERTRELEAATAALRERDAQRVRLLRTVITAQEDERKRIARELHDETTQGLAVLVMGLDSAVAALRSGGPPPRLDEVKALAVHLLDAIHRLILDLRPSVLDDLGLFSAVRWYAERHLQERGVRVRCELGPAPAARLPPEVEIAVFRICQETLNNVARHAAADSVLIQLEASGGELRVEIEDDGRGFDAGGPGPQDRPHYGLLGIRERAELLGGSANIESAPGQGTRVVVRVPLTVAPPPPPAPEAAAP